MLPIWFLAVFFFSPVAYTYLAISKNSVINLTKYLVTSPLLVDLLDNTSSFSSPIAIYMFQTG